MIRPLPPFTTRPLKRLGVRKSRQPSDIMALASGLPDNQVKAQRRAVKFDAPKVMATRSMPRLRVLVRPGGEG